MTKIYRFRDCYVRWSAMIHQNRVPQCEEDYSNVSNVIRNTMLDGYWLQKQFLTPNAELHKVRESFGYAIVLYLNDIRYLDLISVLLKQRYALPDDSIF